MDRIYGGFQTAGMKVTTLGKSEVNNSGLDAYAQIVGLLGADGATPVSAANPLPVAVETGQVAGTGATTTVASSGTPVTLLAANAARLGATVTNDSTAILYVLLGAGTASTSVYTVEMAGTGGGTPSYYEVPFGFTGIITGIWASATGNARMTQITA